MSSVDFRDRRQQPMAQSVPATTAMAVEATAMRKDCQMELSHSGEPSTVA